MRCTHEEAHFQAHPELLNNQQTQLTDYQTPIFLKEALVELPPAVLMCCWLSAVARSNSSVTRGLAPQFLTRAFLPGEKNDSENDQSLAQPPQECGGAPITGDFQDATVQGASR